MNTHDKIELPPLPQGEYRLSPDSRAPTLYDEEAMEAYARAAIEAYRKRRGVSYECEPKMLEKLTQIEKYLFNEVLKLESAYGHNFKKDATHNAREALKKLQQVLIDINKAPQPAEPVRTTSQDEIAAMEAVMQSVDPATWPGLTAAQRCALGRFAKAQNPDNEMIQLGGTAPAVPRWLLNAAQRIEEYMIEHGHEEWAIGGIQKRQFTAHVTN